MITITITVNNTENGCDWEDLLDGIGRNLERQAIVARGDGPAEGQEGIFRNSHNDVIGYWEVTDE